MNTIEVAAEWANMPALSAFADQCEQSLDLADEQSYLLRMAIEEVATNIIKYGYDGAIGVIQLHCSLQNGTLIIRFRDHGQPFDPQQSPVPDLHDDLNNREIGGLGTFFLREFADSMQYEHDQTTGWNTLTITKQRRERSMAERLRNVALFAGLTDAELAALAEHAIEHSIAAGELLFQEGDTGTSCYVILSGALEALTTLNGSPYVLEVRHAGQIMGEMALLDRSPRSATVRAVSQSSLAELDENAFIAVMHADPEVALSLLRSGTMRLRRTNRDMIAALEAKNAQLSTAYAELQAAQSELVRLGRLEEELSVARRIQQLFLPRSLPAPPGWEVAGFTRGAQAVGGDFFDYLHLPGGALGLVIADVAGKGVPAALFVALARSLLRAASLAQVEAGNADLERIMTSAITLTNAYIVREHHESNMFITLFYGVLDPVTGRLVYCNAGHNPPLLVRPSGEVHELALGCLPVGVTEDQELRIESISIAPGETLIGFTDGITEAMNASMQMFGEERLVETLAANPNVTAQQLISTLIRAVDAHVNGAPQSDDITVLVFRQLP